MTAVTNVRDLQTLMSPLPLTAEENQTQDGRTTMTGTETETVPTGTDPAIREKGTRQTTTDIVEVPTENEVPEGPMRVILHGKDIGNHINIPQGAT